MAMSCTIFEIGIQKQLRYIDKLSTFRHWSKNANFSYPLPFNLHIDRPI